MLGLALCLSAAPSQAAVIRVTTWDLQPGALAGTEVWSSKSQQNLVQEAAASLKKLNPDVITLQHIAGWETCHQLIEALKPESYEVAVCSSFGEGRSNALTRQVAILTKTKPYLAWTEPWHTGGAPGGFAFAAIKMRNKNIGFFSVQFGEGAEDTRSLALQQAREASARQLVKQIDSLQDWKNNRLQSFIVAGDFNTTPDNVDLAQEKTLPLLGQLDFDNAFAGLPLEQRVTRPAAGGQADATLDYIFTRDAGRVDPPQLTPGALCGHSAVTCEMDLSAPRRVIAPTPPRPQPQVAHVEPPPVRPSVSPTNRAAAPPVLANAVTPAPASEPPTLWWLAGFAAGALALFFVTRKRTPRLELPSSPAAALELKAGTSAGLAIPQADPIIFPPTSDSPPYVRIEMEGSTQTQSQTWHPHSHSESATMGGAVREGLIAHLSRWFKQKAVQRLVSDRERLLATQQAAGLKVLAVDQRLAKIEHQIQQINHEYERRIDDLLQELVVAKEENRELIRAKIALVKADMEKARLRAAQHAREHEPF